MIISPATMTVQEKEHLFSDLVMEWNKKINLVSRKKTDVCDLINESKIFFDFIDFEQNPTILDLGTGGGFPGIVMKIYYPNIKLTLVDSIQKKIKAVSDVSLRLGFKDVEIICSRAEELKKNSVLQHTFDYIVARSVAPLYELTKWSKELLKPSGKLITLKGGDLAEEVKRTNMQKFVKKLDILEKLDKKIIIAELQN
jgi:16S rRNA (guanine527-N7)-methyltransferase